MAFKKYPVSPPIRRQTSMTGTPVDPDAAEDLAEAAQTKAAMKGKKKKKSAPVDPDLADDIAEMKGKKKK